MERQVDIRVYNALESLKVLLEMFKWERIIYLVVGFASVVFLFVIGIKFIIFSDTMEASNKSLTIALMGSSGLLATAAFRIIYFFNRSFTVVEDALKAYLGGKK